WTASITTEGHAAALAEGDRLVASDDAPLPPKQPWSFVAVHRSGIETEGMEMKDAGALAERLADRRQKVGREDALLIAVGRDATPDQVVMAAGGAMNAGYTHAWFAFARTRSVNAPPRSSATDELDALLHGDAGDRAVKLADLFERTIHGCPALHHAFGQSLSE